MKWSKMGRIFNPVDHDMDYAQSPQTLVFNDFIRIYFSTRKRDLTNGKYISHIAFIDMDKDFKSVINRSRQPVIQLGKLGCFDEHGIFPMNVLRVGQQIYGYTCGWNRKVSVSVDTSIGLAISNDEGLTYIKYGDGPILTASVNEPFLVGDPFVRIYHDTFHMWYIFGVQWKKYSTEGEPDRIYKIGHAISKDGLHWIKDDGVQIISDNLHDEESQALPTVIFFSGQYHMFFCYRHSYDFRNNKNRGYRLGYAYSKDLQSWVRKDHEVGIDVSNAGWDADMMCYPHAFECNNRVYLLYNGNEFGRYGFGLAVLE